MDAYPPKTTSPLVAAAFRISSGRLRAIRIWCATPELPLATDAGGQHPGYPECRRSPTPSCAGSPGVPRDGEKHDGGGGRGETVLDVHARRAGFEPRKN